MDTLNLELFGKDPKVQKAISIARNVSVTKAPVLIVGEIGIGKKVLAQFIHNSSNRLNQPFEIIDCNSDPKFAENKILGYRDESTGRFIKGVLEVANNGTVVFANIDGLEDNFQKRLHKILNEYPFHMQGFCHQNRMDYNPTFFLFQRPNLHQLK